MATTHHPILIPLREACQDEAQRRLQDLAAAVALYGHVRVTDPFAERPADHPDYVLAEMSPDVLLTSLMAVVGSIAAGRYQQHTLDLALAVRDHLAAEILARQERRPDDAF